MTYIDEEALIDMIIRFRNGGYADEDARKALHELLDMKLNELMPLSPRILEGWYHALQINNKVDKATGTC